jgi:hypothetical protein
MHLNFYAASKQIAAFLSKIWLQAYIMSADGLGVVPRLHGLGLVGMADRSEPVGLGVEGHRARLGPVCVHLSGEREEEGISNH